MLRRIATRWRRLIAALSRLPPAMLALVGIVVAAGVSGGGYYAYRTYDYVQHDNEFCMSCHLMAEPFEQFAESPHQGLGCKACHRPNLLDRSQMGLTAVVEDPDEISVHASVPNETCAECHIEGDPEKWRLIASSAGHRVHLESDQLEGLQCVECHATSIHEFAPIDRTCSQSGCHEDNTVQLAGMSDLMVHCAACHSYVAPVADESTILGDIMETALLPDQDECLSCHVMRSLVEMPSPDPHGGGCAVCHNPHEQKEPSDAARSCATMGCHAEADTLTAFHRGLETDVLTDCLYCHQAHDFGLDGSDCASCHETEALEPSDGAVSGFGHGEHEGLECGSCHAEGEQHGAPSVVTDQDCRSCHHTEPVSASCSDCHDASDAPAEVFATVREVEFSVGTRDPARELSFTHAAHVEQDCAACHTEGLTLDVAPDLDCQSCHEEHHGSETTCASCHVAAPVEAHPPSEAHVTCSGSGCHVDVPFESVPRTRAFCLGCHQDLTDHEVGQSCESCHSLPAPRGEGHWS